MLDKDIPVFSSAGPCHAFRAPSDILGDHALCCANNEERIARHNALRDALHSASAAASLGRTKEVRFLLPGNDKRPADVFLPYWSEGRDTAWDVTVRHPPILAILSLTRSLQSTDKWRFKMWTGYRQTDIATYRLNWPSENEICKSFRTSPGVQDFGCNIGP